MRHVSVRVEFIITVAMSSDIGIFRMIVETDAKVTHTFLGIGLALGQARTSSYTL